MAQPLGSLLHSDKTQLIESLEAVRKVSSNILAANGRTAKPAGDAGAGLGSAAGLWRGATLDKPWTCMLSSAAAKGAEALMRW